MEEENRKLVVNMCREAYKKQYDGEFKYFRDMALCVKKQLDAEKEIGGAWHVVVGKLQKAFVIESGLNVGTSFGSYVSYETKMITFFWLEHIGFLCYKHG